jgi:hypothetical protein
MYKFLLESLPVSEQFIHCMRSDSIKNLYSLWYPSIQYINELSYVLCVAVDQEYLWGVECRPSYFRYVARRDLENTTTKIGITGKLDGEIRYSSM